MKILRFLVFALTAAISPHQSGAQTIQVNKENRTIAITATASVTVPADSATVHIGFISYGPYSASAYSTGSNLSNSIIKALTSNGVPADAIESQSQGIAPVQEYQVDKLTPEEKAQRKFQVTQSWSVRTSAADAARVLDLAVKAGANQSGQIDWSLKDEDTPQAQAAAKALQRARSIATEMATGLNAKLGILVYSSNEVPEAPPRPLMRQSQPMAALAAEAPPPPLSVSARRIEKSATVYAVFAIE